MFWPKSFFIPGDKMVIVVMESVEDVCQREDRVLEHENVGVGVISAISTKVFVHPE